MAKKPATAAVDELPPAMDYAQHESTYHAFIAFVRYMIVGLALLMVSLYFFIEGANPVLGAVFLVAIPVVLVVMLVTGRR